MYSNRSFSAAVHESDSFLILTIIIMNDIKKRARPK